MKSILLICKTEMIRSIIFRFQFLLITINSFCDLNKDSQKEIILFNGSNMYTLWFNQTDNLIQENIIFATQNNSAIRIENKK